MPTFKERLRRIWFSPIDSKEDRLLISRLDLLIVPYSILAYFVKYLDQNNLDNAYVSGLKEDLGFKGNELVQLKTFYTVGAVTGQIPFLFILTYFPMHWVIPFLDIAWGVFTLLQFRAQSFAELAAYRFLVGWFEAAFFPAMHYMFGAWYRGDEICRRGGLFYFGLSLGTMTAGLIQSAASANLHMKNGLEGWRWMYIICSLITIPVGVIGYFVIPGTPDQPNRRVLKQHHIDHAVERLKKHGHVSHGKFQFKNILQILKKPHLWIIVAMDVLYWQATLHANMGGLLLWLKSLGTYAPQRITELGSISPAMGIFYTILWSYISDLFLGPSVTIGIGSALNVVGIIILLVWNVPYGAQWFAYLTNSSSISLSPVIHGWVNNLLRASPAERSFTLVLINCLAQSSTAWTPLLVFKTVDAPRWRAGYIFCFVMAVLLATSAFVLRYYWQRLNDHDEHYNPRIPDDEGQHSSEDSVASPVTRQEVSINIGK